MKIFARFVVLAVGTLAAAVAMPARSAPTGEALAAAAQGRLPDFLACLRRQRVALVIAHRGGPLAEYPENALATMRRTASIVPVIIEADVKQSSDGILFIAHDDVLDRMTDGSGRIRDHTWADIRKLRLRDPFGEPTFHHPPLLADVLAENLLMVLEPKTRDRSRFFEEIGGSRANGRVIYLGLTYEEGVRIVSANANAMFMLSLSKLEASEGSAAVRPLARNIIFYGPPDRLGSDAMRKADAMGAPILTWATGNLSDPGYRSADASYRSAADAGVYIDLMRRGAHLIISNRPVEAALALAADPNYSRNLNTCLTER